MPAPGAKVPSQPDLPFHQPQTRQDATGTQPAAISSARKTDGGGGAPSAPARIDEFDRGKAEIWRVAAAGGLRTWSYNRFKKHMRGAFPFLNDAAMRRASTLTGCYTAHEGY